MAMLHEVEVAGAWCESIRSLSCYGLGEMRLAKVFISRTGAPLLKKIFSIDRRCSPRPLASSDIDKARVRRLYRYVDFRLVMAMKVNYTKHNQRTWER